MPILTMRQETTLTRMKRPASDKIIFISCEGQVTEEEYFAIISNLYDGVKSKIRIISVMEDAINTPANMRSREQLSELGKSMPWQLVEKLDKFKEEKSKIYDFENHQDDQFWIIADVDHHTNAENITKWNQMLVDCKIKNYSFAISNPFFEIWLLLHHLEPNEEDAKYAVTEQHEYEKTSHYRERLKNDAKAPLEEGKKPLQVKCTQCQGQISNSK